MAKTAENKKKSGAGKGKGVKPEGQGGLGVVPVNFFKDKTHPPIKPDEEYPNWLWELELPSMPVLSRKDLDDLTLPEMRRLVQLKNREIIKNQNADPSF